MCYNIWQMAKNYHPSEIEPKWQKIWEKNRLFWEVEEGKPKKFYALVEFPYPSGEGLHMGHAFTMTIMDVLARKKRMEGANVLYPMGWDAFGLPTENYAIRTGIHPAVATAKNTARFHQQMKRLGFSYTWSREINTTDPAYYRWTQWIFLQFFKHGLAYKAQMPVGWCPGCKIILANEEIVNGRCERCGAEAERRMQKQWLLRITAYADRLIDDLKLVDYPDFVKEAQINWIGRTQGIIIDYPVVDEKGRPCPEVEKVSCYTTRPDTNFGATFVVIAPEHPILASLVNSKFQIPKSQISEIENYIKMSKKKSEMERTALEKEKTGVFTGWYALNRLTGRRMPIWVADFVVLTAGTGIVVGVPAHDERDFAFAKKYGLEIIPVIKPAKGEWDFSKAPFTEIEGGVVFNSDFLNGLPAAKAIEKISDYLEKKGWGRRAVNYHLRDWIFSRQHYWGEPIPMVWCQKCAKNKITYFRSQLLKNKPKAAVFIDDANLFYAQKKEGWRVDLRKLKNLFAESFSLLKVNYYLTTPQKNDPAWQKTKKFIAQLQKNYKDFLKVKTKPLKYIFDPQMGKTIKKGNVDSEIILDVLETEKDVDLVVIVSGDSHYLSLGKKLLKRSKKVLFVGFEENMAWELRQMKHLYLNRIREKIEFGAKKAPAKTGVPLLDYLYHKELCLSR
ncbi:MAG: leucine--tRNA ligase, partial [Microgenomates group bacterium]